MSNNPVYLDRIKVRQELKRRGWKQEDFAEKIGYTARRIRDWLNGEPINQLALNAIEQAFEKPASEFTVAHVIASVPSSSLGETPSHEDSEDLSALPSPVEIPPQQSGKVQRRRILIAASLLLAGVGGGIGVYSFLNNHPTPSSSSISSSLLPPSKQQLGGGGHQKSVLSVAWSGTFIISGSGDGTVKRWDGSKTPPLVLATYVHGNDPVSSVAWSPKEARFASGSWDTTVKVWNATSATTDALPLIYDEHTKPVHAISWSPDGLYIASGSAKGEEKVNIWNATTKKTVYSIQPDQATGNRHDIDAVVWSPDGEFVAIGTARGVVYLWEKRTNSIVRRFTLPDGVNALAWAPKNKYSQAILAAGCGDIETPTYSQVNIWHVSAKEDEFVYPSLHRQDVVRTVAWSPNGKYIASGGAENMIRVWEPFTGKNIDYKLYPKTVLTVAWSPDGESIVSGNDDSQVYIWKPQLPV